MYHSRTQVFAGEHVRPVGGLIRTRPDRERRWEARHLYDETRFTSQRIFVFRIPVRLENLIVAGVDGGSSRVDSRWFSQYTCSIFQ